MHALTRTRRTQPASPTTQSTTFDNSSRVGVLISNVSAAQWSAPTPCVDWSVRRLVDHLIGMNRVFTALPADAPVPRASTGGQVNEDPVIAYREGAAALLRAFGQPGVLDRQYQGPLGTASGAEWLQIRLYDLLAHGWDLAHATGQPVDLVEPSVAFTRVQLADQSRDGRFGPPQNVDAGASAIERLVAFLGRSITPPP